MEAMRETRISATTACLAPDSLLAARSFEPSPAGFGPVFRF
jgi:hypothetical protein